VNKPVDGSYAATRSTVLNIVCLSLDSDPTLEPKSAKQLPHHYAEGNYQEEDDPTPPSSAHRQDFASIQEINESETDIDEEDDDFIIMSEKQAKRIVNLIQAAFEVDISMNVVVAEANVGALARRILGARSLKGA
jgi:phosphatidylethanolamine N-methyltransferase